MTDVMVTVPKALWSHWLTEGDLAYPSGEPALWEGNAEYGFITGGRSRPDVKPGERVYIVAHGLLRGYAPFCRFDIGERFGGRDGTVALVRRGGAMACTLRSPLGGHLTVRGFQGVRYRWWDYAQEMSFPEWRTEGVS